MVEPTKRASAEAFQLMASHALGEASSPYLLGVITDVFKDTFEGEHASCKLIVKYCHFYIDFDNAKSNTP